MTAGAGEEFLVEYMTLFFVLHVALKGTNKFGDLEFTKNMG